MSFSLLFVLGVLVLILAGSISRKKQMILSAVVTILMSPFFIYDFISSTRRAENNVSALLEAIKKQEIDYIQLEFGSFPIARNNIVCRVDNKDKLSVFKRLINNIGTKGSVGHALTVLEFQIDIGFAKNKKKQYLGWIYNKHPNDIYLDPSLWKAIGNGKYRRSPSGGIRVPNATIWIEQRHQECLKDKKIK